MKYSQFNSLLKIVSLLASVDISSNYYTQILEKFKLYEQSELGIYLYNQLSEDKKEKVKNFLKRNGLENALKIYLWDWENLNDFEKFVLKWKKDKEQ